MESKTHKSLENTSTLLSQTTEHKNKACFGETFVIPKMNNQKNVG